MSTKSTTTKASTNKKGVEAKITQTKNEEITEKKPIKPKEVDLHQYITVYNGFQGELVYESSKTGEVYEWSEFGSTQEIELLELRNAKNTRKKYFANNWFMFDEDWVVDYLGVRQYYKHAVKINDFDNIFKLSPSEIREKISVLSNGQKKSVAYRAKELISIGEIDSNKSIAALEDALGVELIER